MCRVPPPPAMERAPVTEPARFCTDPALQQLGVPPSPRRAQHRARSAGHAPSPGCARIPLPRPNPGTKFPAHAPSLDHPATAMHRARPTIHRAPVTPPARYRPRTETRLCLQLGPDFAPSPVTHPGWSRLCPKPRSCPQPCPDHAPRAGTAPCPAPGRAPSPAFPQPGPVRATVRSRSCTEPPDCTEPRAPPCTEPRFFPSPAPVMPPAPAMPRPVPAGTHRRCR